MIWSLWEEWEPKQKRCAANQGSQIFSIGFCSNLVQFTFLELEIDIRPILGVLADFRALRGILGFSALYSYTLSMFYKQLPFWETSWHILTFLWSVLRGCLFFHTKFLPLMLRKRQVAELKFMKRTHLIHTVCKIYLPTMYRFHLSSILHDLF